MNLAERKAFGERCRAVGLDPDEVAMVAERYAAYRDFAGATGGLPLEGWFRFYRMEKQSELGDNAKGVVSACSATGEGNPHQYLSNPGPFLALLREYLSTTAVAPGTAKSL